MNVYLGTRASDESNTILRELPDNWRQSEISINKDDTIVQPVITNLVVNNNTLNTQVTVPTSHYGHSVNTVVECASAAEKECRLTLIQVEIGGIPVSGLCDTGASHPLMRKSFFEEVKGKYPSANLDVIGSERYKIKSVTEDEIKIRGKININVQVTD